MKEFRIAISGKSGCGNTTISHMVADTLGLKFINFTFRSLAEEKGLEFNEVLELAEADDSWDREIDSRQVKIALDSHGCVLGSRLAIWMLKEADLKVYLWASPETRAGRIVKREGDCPKTVAEFTAKRDQRDKARYLKIYGINNDDYQFADMVINTNELSAVEIAETIVNKAREMMNDNK